MKILEKNEGPKMLTWEELVEHQGKPVYVLDMTDSGIIGYWCIPWGADIIEGDGIIMLCHPDNLQDGGSQSLYGEAFIAYTGPIPVSQGEIC